MRHQTSASCWMLHGRLCLIHATGLKLAGPLFTTLYYSATDIDMHSTGRSEAQTLWESALEKHKIREDRDVLWAYYDFSDHAPISDYIDWRRSVNLK